MGLTRRISSYFKPKVVEKEEYFLQNGSELQAALIAFSSGRHDILIRNFTAKELIGATRSFAERVFTGGSRMFKGHFEQRQILVSKLLGRQILGPSIRNIVVGSHMSHHKNVLKLVGCCLEFSEPACVYEYVEGTLLFELLDSSSNNKYLSWRSRIKIASEVASTLVYLHTTFSTPVIYRDLTPSKVIIDQNGIAKLFDFSLSISLPPGKLHVRDAVRGTSGFIDNNYLSTGYVSQKTDVFSFGGFLLVLLTAQRLFDLARLANDEDMMMFDYVKHYVDNHQYDKIIDPRILEEEGGFGSEDLFQSLVDLALRCTRENEEERPEMIDVAKQLRLMEKACREHLPSVGVV